MSRFLLILILGTLLVSCHRSADFVSVRDGGLFIGDEPYTYVGTNMWYAPILGSEGQGGNRQRLCMELDSLCALGIRNIRILVGGEGTYSDLPDHIRPTLQPRPGEYNDTLLAGLDFVMAEMGKRDMRAVLYLHNAWQWSGGYGAYLDWAGMGHPAPASLWNEYTAHHSQFVRSDSARALALRHTRFIVSRTNTITGKAYKDDHTLMAWEVCNEPRAFSRDSVSKQGLLSWISEQSEAIKEIDPHHLVTTGSEGLYGCEVDINLFRSIHALPTIDYLCFHIWPYTWGWTGRFVSPNSEARQQLPLSTLSDSLPAAISKTQSYIDLHHNIAQELRKPLVLEEFGYPRDSFEIASGTPTRARDQYFQYILSQVGKGRKIAGCNFWAWGGMAQPTHPMWQPWDAYTGDPAQEEQGLYSVFLSDRTTLSIIRK